MELIQNLLDIVVGTGDKKGLVVLTELDIRGTDALGRVEYVLRESKVVIGLESELFSIGNGTVNDLLRQLTVTGFRFLLLVDSAHHLPDIARFGKINVGKGILESQAKDIDEEYTKGQVIIGLAA